MNFGKLKKFEQNGNEIKVIFEEQEAYFTVVRDDIIRVFVPCFSKECVSKAIEGNKVTDTEFAVEQAEGLVTITTGKIKAEIFDNFVIDFRKPDGTLILADYRKERTIKEKVSWETIEMLEAEGHDTSKLTEEKIKYQIVKQLDDGDDFYGLGDKSGFLNKKHYEYENWNSDIPQAHNEDYKALYKSIPILLCLKKHGAYGVFFDNTFRSNINLGKENTEYFYYTAEDGNLDYYFIE